MSEFKYVAYVVGKLDGCQCEYLIDWSFCETWSDATQEETRLSGCCNRNTSYRNVTPLICRARDWNEVRNGYKEPVARILF